MDLRATSHFPVCAALTVAVGVMLAAQARAADPPHADLTEAEVKNLVQRSYPYVALFNVIHKAGALRGWNQLGGRTALADDLRKVIARPNNDTLLGSVPADLRADALVVDYPAIDSDYVSLEVCGYDHYCDVILSTRQGDFAKPARILFYSARTKDYTGEPIPGVDRIVKMTSDFCVTPVRVMPHSTERPRNEKIVQQLQSIKVQTLSEFLGRPKQATLEETPPVFGTTDADVFGTNLLEVMQFVFNHTTFDLQDPIDQAVLALYRPLGIEPGKKYDAATAARPDPALFRRVAEQVAAEERTRLVTRQFHEEKPRLFRPKGQMEFSTLLFQSVIGPIGLPAEEATYMHVPTTDGQPMNAKYDYVIRLTQDELPPAKAFWSFTLYDTKDGFFIPNDRKKYSVGRNAGMKLNTEGGIEIYIAAEKPAGVPEENWLPIQRMDQQLDISVRMYVPDLERLSQWSAPKAERWPGPQDR